MDSDELMDWKYGTSKGQPRLQWERSIKWTERQGMRYPPIFATIFSKNICKTRENVWCTFMSPSSSFNNYGHFFLLSCYLAKEIPHHTFPPEDRTCHAFILSCAFSWCRHTEEHVSGARSLTGGSPIWQMASWWLQKKQLPWWSSFAAQLWELVLRMQPRIDLICRKFTQYSKQKRRVSTNVG